VRLCGIVVARGRGARERLRSRTTTALALSTAALLALCVGVAQAEPPKLIFYGKFSTGEYPLGIAVDNSSLASPAGDVYVAGAFGVSNIGKYDASGKLISPPSPFGSASYGAAAVNPTNGDVYAVDAENQRIDTYTPSTGALLSSFAVAGCANGLFGSFIWTQIATDSLGNVYLACAPKDEVEVFGSSGGAPSGGVAATIAGSGANALSEPTGVAVDSSGNVWVADSGHSRVEEFSSSGTFVSEMRTEEGLRSIALDSHGDVLALVHNGTDACGSYPSPCTHVVEYSSSGVKVADIGAGSIGTFLYPGSTSVSLESYGMIPLLAVNESSGRVYVADLQNSVAWVYGPPTVPSIGMELSAEVTTSEAKLGALANPGGIPASYRFEYDTREYREGEGPHGQSTPFPEGSAGEGLASRTVWASANGLSPDTTYHYRVVVSNELGTVMGADHTFTTETAAQAACPNEQFRGGFSASLPDCRAYELVTPSTKTSAQPDPEKSYGQEVIPFGQAAIDGNRVSYEARDILPGADSGGIGYVAARNASGWSSENVVPLQSYTGDRCTGRDATVRAYSADLTRDVVTVGGGQTPYATEKNSVGGGCGAEDVTVVSGEPQDVENLLLRENLNASYQLINVLPGGIEPTDARFQGASADGTHVVFDEVARLTPNALDGVENLYEWSGGIVRLVTVLPDGSPAAGSLATSGSGNGHVVSADGSHIFFTAGGKLYVRLNGSTTVQVDASQAGGGQFQDASIDGSHMFFTDDASAALTSNTAPGSGTNLYQYDVATRRLVDVTPGGVGSTGLFDVRGISADGSYLYFTAGAPLATGATAGLPNLYLWHEGAVTFIATLSVNESYLCSTNCPQASDKGRFLAFATTRSLTGYNNVDANTGNPDPEIYLYDSASNQVTCVSCDPSGQAPAAGGARLQNSAQAEPPVGGKHRLTDGGQLFFETREALLPLDTNGQIDVYEYENGHLHLISTGTSSRQSAFIDASENGNDVFFITRQRLVPQDSEEEARVIYDARVEGGFPVPVSPPACTTADACRAPVSPQPSIYGAPSSQTFSGEGNLVATSPWLVEGRAVSGARKLGRALKSCRARYRHSKKRRVVCERRARAAYRPVKKAVAKAKSHKGGK
jgi:hypothetical protein